MLLLQFIFLVAAVWLDPGKRVWLEAGERLFLTPVELDLCVIGGVGA